MIIYNSYHLHKLLHNNPFYVKTTTSTPLTLPNMKTSNQGLMCLTHGKSSITVCGLLHKYFPLKIGIVSDL